MGNLRLVISLRPQNRVCIDFFLSVNIQFRAQIILFYFYQNEAFQTIACEKFKKIFIISKSILQLRLTLILYLPLCQIKENEWMASE